MIYKAKNVDTDKALKEIEASRRYQERAFSLRIEKERSYFDGVSKGLDIAEGIFTCSNYEKAEELTFDDGVKEMLYELGKEMDIQTQDIRDNLTSVDEAAALLADRIKESLG